MSVVLRSFACSNCKGVVTIGFIPTVVKTPNNDKKLEDINYCPLCGSKEIIKVGCAGVWDITDITEGHD